MNEYLKNLTPLDSSQLEVFLRIFGKFFIFLNLDSLKPVGTGTGPNQLLWPGRGLEEREGGGSPEVHGRQGVE